MSFSNKVFKVVRDIPHGKVMTYKEVATFAGNSKAYKVVGKILHKNPDMKNIPCHRVIRSDFNVGDYAYGGIEAKKKKLQAEGLIIEGDKVVFKIKKVKQLKVI
jgi:O-6-methylguanine DNA methyltransferase